MQGLLHGRLGMQMLTHMLCRARRRTQMSEEQHVADLHFVWVCHCSNMHARPPMLPVIRFEYALQMLAPLFCPGCSKC